MNKLIATLLVSFAGSAFAQNGLTVKNELLGTGTPLVLGTQEATYVGDGMYHVPQYMPGRPTAATLYPRVVDIDCVKTDGKFVCEGYNLLAAISRGEYLYVRPHEIKVPEPQLIIQPQPPVHEVLNLVDRIVVAPVPIKPKKHVIKMHAPMVCTPAPQATK